MIMLSIFCAAVAIAIITIVVGTVFGYSKNRTLKSIFRAAIVAAAFCGVFCGVLGGIYANDVNEIKATYADLVLYQPLVEETSNEYIRYDFYDKVNTYNEMYDTMETNAASDWFGALVNKNWNENCAHIDFFLHGMGE